MTKSSRSGGTLQALLQPAQRTLHNIHEGSHHVNTKQQQKTNKAFGDLNFDLPDLMAIRPRKPQGAHKPLHRQ